MTVAELGQRMSAAELAQWAEYADVEPFGSHFDDLRAGTIASAIYNVNRDPKTRPEPFDPLDLTPWNALRQPEPAAPPAQPLDPDALSAKLDAVLFGRAPT